MRSSFTLLLCMTLLLAAAVTAYAQDRFPIQLSFADNTANLQIFKRNKKANVTLEQITTDSTAYARLTVDPTTPSAAAMMRDINLTPGQFNVMRISMTYRAHDLHRGQVKMIVYAYGGKLPGNRTWHITDAPLDCSGWISSSMYLTVPEDANKLHIRLMLDDGSGVLELKQINIDALNHTSESLTPIDLNFPENTEAYCTFSPLLLGVNMVFSLPGAYYGTLPTDHPQSQRQNFVTHLQQTGFTSVRFPGGTPSHWYLAGYPKQTHELLIFKDKHLKNQHHSVYPHGHVPDWANVRDTFKQAQIKIIYQLNTSTFVDDAGQIQSVLDNKFTRSMGFADGKDHVQEAAAALARDFAKGIFTPGQVDVWELGNEEHAKMSIEQYANIVNAYTRVLMKVDPDTPICFSGHWDALPFVDADVVKHLSGETSHYPFSQWPRPYPPQATSDLIQLSQVHMGMAGNCKHYAELVEGGKRPAHMKLSITETGIYKYFTFDPFKSTASYAHALAFAGNWPQMISQPIVNIAVLHDLESIFFGSMMYNVKFKPALRQFDWIEQDENVPTSEEKPMPGAELKKTIYYAKQYVPMPTTQVSALLGQMVGTRIAHAPANPARQITGNLLGIKDGKVYLFVCNPTDMPHRVKLNLPASITPSSHGTWQSLQADNVFAVLDTEYRQVTQHAPDLTQTANHVLLPAYSVNLFVYE